jgi:hypothetical protein
MFNLSGALAGGGGHHHHHAEDAGAATEAQPIGQGAAAPAAGSKDELAQALGAAADRAAVPVAAPAGPGSPRAQDRPSVKVEHHPPFRPTPTDNMTSSQWFAEEFANTTKGR